MSTPRRINGILTSQFEIPSESNEQPISHPLIQAIAADNLEDAIKNSNRLSEPTKLNAIKLCERRATPVAQKIYSLLTGQKFLKPKPSESIVDELDRKFSAASIKNDITTQAAVCSEPKFDKPKKHATKASSYDVSAKKQERLTFYDEASYYSYLDIQAMNGNWDIIKRFLKESEKSEGLEFITEKLKIFENETGIKILISYLKEKEGENKYKYKALDLFQKKSAQNHLNLCIKLNLLNHEHLCKIIYDFLTLKNNELLSLFIFENKEFIEIEISYFLYFCLSKYFNESNKEPLELLLSLLTSCKCYISSKVLDNELSKFKHKIESQIFQNYQRKIKKFFDPQIMKDEWMESKNTFIYSSKN